MDNHLPVNAETTSFLDGNRTLSGGDHLDRWSMLAASAILVLGSPRSGTSWLAKIFDSHPAVLYRHEPDELISAVAGLHPSAQLAAWIRQRGLRSAAKRPWFRKSWRPAALDATWRGLAATLAAAQRMPLTARIAASIGLPDLVPTQSWNSVRAAVKLVNWDGSLVARTMPEARCVFILRHPCGQIASIMAGLASKRFAGYAGESDAPMALAEAAAWASRHGVDTASFNALPENAKYAWAWRAFNEPAVHSMAGLRNARIVIYEDLCRDPEATTKDLFAFAGLAWNPQTAAFLGESTQDDRAAGYYDVFRKTPLVVERWRQTMTEQDQDCIRTVLRTSPLAGNWPDLATA